MIQKKIAFYFLTCLFFFLAGQTSFASLFIEPHIGYHLNGDVTQSQDSFNGVGYGVRGGVSHTGLLLGIGYEKADLNFKSTVDYDASATELYGFMGYQFPALFRVWFGYGFQSTVEYPQNTQWEGKGLRVGVGYTGFSFISLNIEYQKKEDFKLSGVHLSHELSSWFASISFPFEF